MTVRRNIPVLVLASGGAAVLSGSSTSRDSGGIASLTPPREAHVPAAEPDVARSAFERLREIAVDGDSALTVRWEGVRGGRIPPAGPIRMRRMGDGSEPGGD